MLSSRDCRRAPRRVFRTHEVNAHPEIREGHQHRLDGQRDRVDPELGGREQSRERPCRHQGPPCGARGCSPCSRQGHGGPRRRRPASALIRWGRVRGGLPHASPQQGWRDRDGRAPEAEEHERGPIAVRRPWLPGNVRTRMCETGSTVKPCTAAVWTGDAAERRRSVGAVARRLRRLDVRRDRDDRDHRQVTVGAYREDIRRTGDRAASDAARATGVGTVGVARYGSTTAI